MTTPSPLVRLGARFIDNLILLIPTAILTFLIFRRAPLGPGNWGIRGLIAGLFDALLAYGYFVVMESSQGSTIGKRVLGLGVHSAEGNPTLEQAARRNSWMLLAILPRPLGNVAELAIAVAIGFSIDKSPTGQGFHDRFAGLEVERT